MLTAMKVIPMINDAAKQLRDDGQPVTLEGICNLLPDTLPTNDAALIGAVFAALTSIGDLQVRPLTHSEAKQQFIELFDLFAIDNDRPRPMWADQRILDDVNECIELGMTREDLDERIRPDAIVTKLDCIIARILIGSRM